jgi:hypothetical protein
MVEVPVKTARMTHGRVSLGMLIVLLVIQMAASAPPPIALMGVVALQAYAKPVIPQLTAAVRVLLAL